MKAMYWRVFLAIAFTSLISIRFFIKFTTKYYKLYKIFTMKAKCQKEPDNDSLNAIFSKIKNGIRRFAKQWLFIEKQP